MTSHGTQTLDARVQRLEDIEDVRELIGIYFDSVDRGYDLAALAPFLDDAFNWTSNLTPPLASREEFVAFQAETARVVEWAFHLVFPIRIEVVHGTEALARWNTLGLHTMQMGGAAELREPVIYTATYDSRFVKRTSGWKIASMAIDFKQISRLTHGWVEEQFFDFQTASGQ